MKSLADFATLLEKRQEAGMALFYFSRPGCGICGAIKPKVASLLRDFPEIRSYEVNLDEMPEAAGQLSVLTIPAVLAYADGKEVVREARYMSMDDLAGKIRRPYSFVAGE